MLTTACSSPRASPRACTTAAAGTSGESLLRTRATIAAVSSGDLPSDSARSRISGEEEDSATEREEEDEEEEEEEEVLLSAALPVAEREEAAVRM